MKRLLIILVLLTFISSVSSTYAKAPFEGNSCQKLGQKRIYKKLEYKCERISKKLIWVRIKVNSAKESSNPIPMPTPSPIPTTSPQPIPTPTTKSSEPNYQESSRRADPETCRLKDQRKNQELRLDHFERNNGFPLQGATLPTKGKLKLLSILVDFPDALGTLEDLKMIREQEKVMVAWFSEASQGKLTAEVITSDKWFRAPKASVEYELLPTQYGLHPKYAQEFIDLTGTSFNWDGVNAFMVHFPTSQKTKLQSAQLGRAVELNTPQGRKSLNYQYFGTLHIDFAKRVKDKNPDYLAGQWIHEHLHDLGLTLHAPGNGFYTGLGQNQGSYSQMLSAWELFKLDWLSDNQIFCTTVSEIESTFVNLVPLEIFEKGNRAAIVVLDKSKALVIESRRALGLSKRWPKDLSGIYVYQIDTSVDTDRTQEFNGSGLDNGNNRKFPKWAFYLDSDQRPIDDSIPNNKVDPEKFYQDWLIRVGESVTTESVKIDFRKSDQTDWIEITRN